MSFVYHLCSFCIIKYKVNPYLYRYRAKLPQVPKVRVHREVLVVLQAPERCE